MLSFRAITWNEVKEFIRQYPDLTNREIALGLEAQQSDVTQLTVLMTKAGELDTRNIKLAPHHQRLSRIHRVRGE